MKKQEKLDNQLIMDWRSPNKKIWIRTIAVSIIVAFLNQDIVWAQGGAPDWHKNPGASPSINPSIIPAENIVIPKTIASKRDVHIDKSGKTVINIQDAHSSIGAQESIVSILKALADDYDLKLVAIEGSSGYIDTSLLRTFPDEALRKKMADTLVKNGKMSAGEFFSVTSAKPITLYGIEDKDLYKKNVDQFRLLYEASGKIREDVKGLLITFGRLQDKVYPKYARTGRSSIVGGIGDAVSLGRKWEDMRELAVKVGLDYREYANIAKFAKSLDIEKTVDFVTAEAERGRLIDVLGSQIAKRDLEELVTRSIFFKDGKMSRGEYHEYLKKLADSNGVALDQYKNLCRYTDYVLCYEEIDVISMFKELREFEDSINMRLFTSDRQKKLFMFSRCAQIASDMLEARADNGEVEYLMGHIDDLESGKMSAFINETAAEYKVEPGHFDMRNVFIGMRKALTFYRTVDKRNAAILSNTIKRMDREGQSVAALITGGYHTKDLSQLLKKSQLSYMVLLPKFDRSKGERPYAAILTRKSELYKERIDKGDYLAIGAYFEADGSRTEAKRFAQYRADFQIAIDDALAGVKDEAARYKKARALIGAWSDNYHEFYDDYMRVLRYKAPDSKAQITAEIRPAEEVDKFLFSLLPRPPPVLQGARSSVWLNALRSLPFIGILAFLSITMLPEKSIAQSGRYGESRAADYSSSASPGTVSKSIAEEKTDPVVLEATTSSPVEDAIRQAEELLAKGQAREALGAIQKVKFDKNLSEPEKAKHEKALQQEVYKIVFPPEPEQGRSILQIIISLFLIAPFCLPIFYLVKTLAAKVRDDYAEQQAAKKKMKKWLILAPILFALELAGVAAIVNRVSKRRDELNDHNALISKYSAAYDNDKKAAGKNVASAGLRIIPVLMDSDCYNKSEMLDLVVEKSGRSSLDTLLTLLEYSPDRSVRSFVAASLHAACKNRPETFGSISPFLQDENEEVKNGCANAISVMGSGVADNVLSMWKQDPKANAGSTYKILEKLHSVAPKNKHKEKIVRIALEICQTEPAAIPSLSSILSSSNSKDVQFWRAVLFLDDAVSGKSAIAKLSKAGNGDAKAVLEEFAKKISGATDIDLRLDLGLALKKLGSAWQGNTVLMSVAKETGAIWNTVEKAAQNIDDVSLWKQLIDIQNQKLQLLTIERTVKEKVPEAVEKLISFAKGMPGNTAFEVRISLGRALFALKAQDLGKAVICNIIEDTDAKAEDVKGLVEFLAARRVFPDGTGYSVYKAIGALEKDNNFKAAYTTVRLIGPASLPYLRNILNSDAYSVDATDNALRYICFIDKLTLPQLYKNMAERVFKKNGPIAKAFLIALISDDRYIDQCPDRISENKILYTIEDALVREAAFKALIKAGPGGLSVIERFFSDRIGSYASDNIKKLYWDMSTSEGLCALTGVYVCAIKDSMPGMAGAGEKEYLPMLLLSSFEEGKINDFISRAMASAGKPIIPTLRAGLSYKEVPVKRAVTFAFAEIKDPSTLPDLGSVINDPDTQVRINASRGIADIGGDEAVKILVGKFGDDSEEVRENVARGVSKGVLLNKDTLKYLEEYLGEKCSGREHVAECLVRNSVGLSDNSVLERVSLLDSMPTDVSAVLIKGLETADFDFASKTLFNFASNNSEAVRAPAVRVLGMLGKERAAEFAAGLFVNEAAEDVLKEIRNIIAKYADDHIVWGLIEKAVSIPVKERGKYTTLFKEVGSRASKIMIAMLDDSLLLGVGERSRALQNIAKSADPAALDDYRIKRSGEIFITELGSFTSVFALFILWFWMSASVLYIMRRIRFISKCGRAVEEVEGFSQALWNVTSTRPATRLKGVEALANFDYPVSKEAIAKRVLDSKGEVREKAIEICGDKGITMGIGRIKTVFGRDRHFHVRLKALEALDKLGDRSNSEYLRLYTLLSQMKYSAICVNYGDRAFSMLEPLLKDLDTGMHSMAEAAVRLVIASSSNVEFLFTLISSKTGFIAEAATDRLCGMRTAGISTRAVAALRANRKAVRIRALSILAAVKDPDTVRNIAPLTWRFSRTRGKAIAAVESIIDSVLDVGTAMRMLDLRFEAVQKPAIVKCGKLADFSAYRSVEPFTRHRNTDISNAAHAAICLMIESLRHEDRLLGFLKSDRDDYFSSAIKALVAMNARTPKVMARLNELFLQCRSSLKRTWILHALNSFGDDRYGVIRNFYYLYNDQPGAPPNVVTLSPDVYAEVIRIFEEGPSGYHYSKTVNAFSAVSDPGAVRAFRQAFLSGIHSDAAHAVAQMMARIANDECLEVLDEAWMGRNFSARIAADKSMSGLLANMKDGHKVLMIMRDRPHLMQHAVSALGSMRYEGAIKTIAGLISDKRSPAMLVQKSVQSLHDIGTESASTALIGLYIDLSRSGSGFRAAREIKKLILSNSGKYTAILQSRLSVATSFANDRNTARVLRELLHAIDPGLVRRDSNRPGRGSGAARSILLFLVAGGVLAALLAGGHYLLAGDICTASQVFTAGVLPFLALPEKEGDEHTGQISGMMHLLFKAVVKDARSRAMGNPSEEAYEFTRRDLQRWVEFIGLHRKEWGVEKAFIKGAFYIFGDRMQSEEDRQRFVGHLRKLDLGSLAAIDNRPADLELLLNGETADRFDLFFGKNPAAIFSYYVSSDDPGTEKAVDTVKQWLKSDDRDEKAAAVLTWSALPEGIKRRLVEIGLEFEDEDIVAAVIGLIRSEKMGGFEESLLKISDADKPALAIASLEALAELSDRKFADNICDALTNKKEQTETEIAVRLNVLARLKNRKALSVLEGSLDLLFDGSVSGKVKTAIIDLFISTGEARKLRQLVTDLGAKLGKDARDIAERLIREIEARAISGEPAYFSIKPAGIRVSGAHLAAVERIAREFSEDRKSLSRNFADREDGHIEENGGSVIKQDSFYYNKDTLQFKDARIRINNRQEDKSLVPPAKTSDLVPISRTIKDLEKLAFAVEMREPVLLVGETGTGKTALVRYLAHLTKNNLRRFNLNGQTDKTEFIGGYKPEGSKGGFRWEEGVLLKAMRNGHWILLDELNLAEPEVIERIRYLLNPNGMMVISEYENQHWIPAEQYDKMAADYIKDNRPQAASEARLAEMAVEALTKKGYQRIHENFRIFATMNPSWYEGRKTLSPAFMNRFRIKWIDELTPSEISRILKFRYQLDDDSIVKIMMLCKKLAEISGREGKLGRDRAESYYFTIRHVQRLADRVRDRLRYHFERGEKRVNMDRIVALAAKSVYGDLLRERSDMAIFEDMLIAAFGGKITREDLVDNDNEIVPRARSVSIGDIELTVNRQGGEDVPLKGSSLFHGRSTRRELKKLAEAINLNEKILLVGPTGVGKTAYIKELARLTNNNFVRVSLDSQADSADLIGRFIPKEGTQGEFTPIFGTLIKAMREGSWILLDEFNLAEPDVLERINSLLDEDAYIDMSEFQGGKILPDPNFRIFAAMNPTAYAGRSKISFAMRNKFTEKWVSGEVDDDELEAIVKFYLTDPDITDDMPIASDLIANGIAAEMAKCYRKVVSMIESGRLGSDRLSSGDVGHCNFSLRDLRDWAVFIRRLGYQAIALDPTGLKPEVKNSLDGHLAGAGGAIESYTKPLEELCRKDEKAIYYLAIKAKDPSIDRSVRLVSLHSLGGLFASTPVIEETLLALLGDKDQAVRDAAIQILYKQIKNTHPDADISEMMNKDLVSAIKELKTRLGIDVKERERVFKLTLTDAVIEGAMYIFKDRLEGLKDKEIFQNEILKRIDQTNMGAEEVDIDSKDVLDREGMSPEELMKEKLDDGKETSLLDIKAVELVSKFDSLTRGFPDSVKVGLTAIRNNLIDAKKIGNGVRGFALLPAEIAEVLIEDALKLEDPEVKMAVAEVIAHLWMVPRFEEELIGMLSDKEVKVRLTAAVACDIMGLVHRDENGKESPLIKKDVPKLPFEKTVNQLIKQKSSGDMLFDYLGFSGVTGSTIGRAHIIAANFAAYLLVLPYVLHMSLYHSVIPAAAIAFTPILLTALFVLFWNGKYAYKGFYRLIYAPQFSMIRARYEKLPLNIADFYELMNPNNRGAFIMESFPSVTKERKNIAETWVGLAATWTISVFSGVAGALLFSGAFWRNLYPVICENVLFTYAAGGLLGYALGYLFIRVLMISIMGLSELGYNAFIYVNKTFRLLPAIFHSKGSSKAMLKAMLPYDKEIIDVFARNKSELEDRADTNKKIAYSISDMYSSLKDDKVTIDANSLTIDNIRMPLISAKDRMFVPEEENAKLVNTISAVKNLKKVAISYYIDDPALLVGETGVGKTSLIRYLMYLAGGNFRRFNLSGQTDKTEFIGGYKPDREGRLRWVPGILVEAMKHGYVLVLDEINLADSSVLERMNSLLDDDRSIKIPEHADEKWISAKEYDAKMAARPGSTGTDENGTRYLLLDDKRYYRIDPGFRLFATMNPADYAGRNILSPAQMNRYRVKWIDDFRQSEWMLIFKRAITDKKGECLVSDDAIARFFFAHGRIQALSQEGMIGAEQRDRFYFTIRDGMRVAGRVKMRVEEKELLSGKKLAHDEVENIFIEEIIEMYASRIRGESDLEILMDCITVPFGKFTLEQNDRISNYPDKIYFGDVPLEINPVKSPYVPGPASLMDQTATTRKYLRWLAKAVKMSEKPLLVGETGTGKTSLIRDLAARTNNSFIRISLDAQTDTSELIGQNVPREGTRGDFQWVYGKLVEAMEKGYWVLLDEFNLAEPEILERINPLLDDDGCLVITELENQTWIPEAIYLKKLNKEVDKLRKAGRNDSEEILKSEAEKILRDGGFRRIHPGFRIFAAMNPDRYSGRNRISIAMRNKLTELAISGIEDKDELESIARSYLSGFEAKDVMAKRMVDFYVKMNIAVKGEAFKGGGIERYQFSIRELRAWVNYIKRFSDSLGSDAAFIKGALYLYYDRLEKEEDRQRFKELLGNSDSPGAKKYIKSFTERAVGPGDFIPGDNEKVKIFDTVIPVNEDADKKEYVQSLEEAGLIKTTATVSNLEKIAQAIILDEPVLLVGETGAGKTSLVRYLAHLTRNSFRRFNLCAQTEKTDFIGSCRPGKEMAFEWQDKILVQAMQKGYWLVLDEINLAPSQVIERLNSLLDDDGFLVITEHEGEIYLKHSEYQRRLRGLANKFKGEGAAERDAFIKAEETMRKDKYRPIHKDFRLIATMNPSEYAGRQVFSPALMNRFRVKWIDELSDDDMKVIIMEKFGISFGVADAMIKVYRSIKHHAEDLERDSVHYTVRHMLRWANRIRASLAYGWTKDMNSAASVEGMEVFGDGLNDEDNMRDLKGGVQTAMSTAFGHDGADTENDISPREGKMFFGNVSLDTRLGAREKYIEGLQLYPTGTSRGMLKKLAKAVLLRENILLVGPTGGGKTNLPRHLADLINRSFTALDLDGQTDSSQLIGQWIPSKEGGYRWVWGDLVNALDRDWWILLDEINQAEPEIIERINSILDDDAFLVVNEHEGNVFRRKESFNLFTAMNPSHYAGRTRLSIAMLNKFHQLWVPQDMKDEEEVDIVSHYFRVRSAEQKAGASGNGRLLPAVKALVEKFAMNSGSVAQMILLGLGLYIYLHHNDAAQYLVMAGIVGPVFTGAWHQREKDDRSVKSVSTLLLKYLFGIEDAKAEAKPEEEGLGWFKVIQSNVKSMSINRIARRIDAITKIYSKDFDMKLRSYSGKLWSIDYSTDPPTIRYPEQDLKDKSAECIVGSAIHEGGHRDISWGVPKTFLEKEAYRLLLNGIEDPRVNNWEVERLPGSDKYIQAAWKDGFPKNPPEAFKDDRVYPNVQYVLGVIHHWFHQEEHPSIKNPRVLEALQKTRKSVQEIYNTHAGKVTISRRDEDMVEISSIAYGKGLYRLPRVAGKVFLRRNDIGSIERTNETHVEISTAKGKEVIELPAVGDKVTRLVSIWPSADEKKKAFLEVVRRIKSEVMPEYDKLVQESIDIAKQSGGKSGSGSNSSSGGNQSAESKAKGDVESQSKDFADSFGSQMIPDKDKKVDDQEEKDGQGQGQSGKNEPKDKSGKSSGGSAQKDEGSEKDKESGKEDGKGSGQEDVADDKDKEKDGQGAASGKDKDKSDKDKSDKDKSGKDKAGDKDGSKRSDQGKGKADGDKGSKAKEGAEDSSEKADAGGADKEANKGGKSGGSSERGGRGVFDLQERLRLEREIARTVQSKTTDYDKYYAKVATLIEKLFGVLNNELQKDTKFRWKGDFPDGANINMKKAMTGPFTGDTNIFRRRTKPTKRSFKITIVLDESGSMNSEGKTESAILSMVVLQEVLLRLNIDFAIEGFSDSPSLHKRFDQKFGHQDKGKLLASIEEFIRRGGGTNDDLAIASAVKGLEAESSDSKVIIVITDGGSGNPESLEAKIKEANRKGIAVVGIGIGANMAQVKSIYRPGIVVEKVEDLPMVLGKVLIDIILWNKIKAVPYYGPRAAKDEARESGKKPIEHIRLVKYGLGHLLAAGIGIAGTMAIIASHPAQALVLGVAAGMGLFHFAMHGITALYIIDRKKRSGAGSGEYNIAETVTLADDGMYIFEQPEFYTLPYLVRRYILLHESAHLRGFGEPAAYIFPWLGLFRKVPFAVSKKASSGLVIGVRRDANDDTIRAVRESAGDEAYILRVADEAELGVLIKNSGLVGIFVDKTISAGYLRRHKLIKEAYMVKLARDYGFILSVNEISDKTRREITESIKAVLPDVEKLSFTDIARRLKEAESTAGFGAKGQDRLRRLVSARSSELRRTHNSGADEAIEKAAASGKAIVAVTTENVAVHDDQFIYNLKKASDKGVINYFGYGEIFKDEDEARRSLVACGYAGSMKNIRFLRTAGRSRADIVGDIVKDVPGVSRESIGIRAVAGEIKKGTQDSGVLLEIPSLTVKGHSIYPVIHTYRILLEILTAVGPGSIAAEGLGIPGVYYDSVKKIFMYMPKSLPIDYDKDMESYRNAVMLLSSAA